MKKKKRSERKQTKLRCNTQTKGNLWLTPSPPLQPPSSGSVVLQKSFFCHAVLLWPMPKTSMPKDIVCMWWLQNLTSAFLHPENKFPKPEVITFFCQQIKAQHHFVSSTFFYMLVQVPERTMRLIQISTIWAGKPNLCSNDPIQEELVNAHLCIQLAFPWLLYTCKQLWSSPLAHLFLSCCI